MIEIVAASIAQLERVGPIKVDVSLDPDDDSFHRQQIKIASAGGFQLQHEAEVAGNGIVQRLVVTVSRTLVLCEHDASTVSNAICH